MRAKSLLSVLGVGGILLGLATSLPILTLAGAALVVGSFFIGRGQGQGDPEIKNLGEGARWLTRPLRELRTSLREMASNPSVSIETSVLAQESVAEADKIYDHALQLLETRDKLKKSIKGRGLVETELNSLTRRYKEAATAQEREAIEAALSAKQKQMGALDEAQDMVRTIDSKLSEAEATLSEIKTRLSLLTARQNETDDAEFAALTNRLKSLTTTFDEVESLTQVNIHE